MPFEIVDRRCPQGGCASCLAEERDSCQILEQNAAKLLTTSPIPPQPPSTQVTDQIGQYLDS